MKGGIEFSFCPDGQPREVAEEFSVLGRPGADRSRIASDEPLPQALVREHRYLAITVAHHAVLLRPEGHRGEAFENERNPFSEKGCHLDLLYPADLVDLELIVGLIMEKDQNGDSD
jgi:hypothetical protein